MTPTTGQMSYENLETILKYLPEPIEVEVTLSNFDYSNVHEQARKISKKLDLELKGLGHQPLEARLKNPSKDKILKIYKGVDRKREVRLRTGEEDLIFISFKEARWRLNGMKIKLDPFEISVRCCTDIPDYINKMREELQDRRIRYKIEQIPYLREQQLIFTDRFYTIFTLFRISSQTQEKTCYFLFTNFIFIIFINNYFAPVFLQR